MGDLDSRASVWLAGLAGADERGGRREAGGRVTEVHRRMIRLRTVTYYWPYTESLARVSGFPF